MSVETCNYTALVKFISKFFEIAIDHHETLRLLIEYMKGAISY
jgi:hypothetical protein